jgi:hypothetical protein
MARYFLHLRDGSDELLDPEGKELDDSEALRRFVLETVRDLLAGDARAGVIDLRFRIDAEDQDGRVAYSLPFHQAVNIIPG